MPDLSADLVARQARADYEYRRDNLQRFFTRREALLFASLGYDLEIARCAETSDRWVCVRVDKGGASDR